MPSQQNLGVCALCLVYGPLELSHLVPAFFFKYLKKSSATGYMRSVENPNFRIQDGPKEYLLCRDCEIRFCKLETAFARKYFITLQSDDFTTITYDEDLYQFALSIAWRILQTSHTQLALDQPTTQHAVREALDKWRGYLLGGHKSCKTSIHMFVFSGIPKTIPHGAHRKTLHYMLRSIDPTVYFSPRGCGVYIKLLRSLFVVPIYPSELRGLKNTRVHRGSGGIVSPQSLENADLGSFLSSRIALAYANEMSEAQRSIVQTTAEKNLDRTLNSESFKITQATSRLIR